MSPQRDITAEEKAAMQAALTRLGFYHDKVDGRWGKNSIAAMAAWQAAHAFPIADGIPTYQQMVVLGATKPEVIRTKRSSLLLRLVPLAFKLLPKVNLTMNPLLLALGRANKATVAAIVSCVATLLLLFGIDLSPDTQGILITVGTAIVTGLVTWLVPNAPPPPLAVAGLLQASINASTAAEYAEYAEATWPVEPVAPDLQGDNFVVINTEGSADVADPRPASGV